MPDQYQVRAVALRLRRQPNANAEVVSFLSNGSVLEAVEDVAAPSGWLKVTDGTNIGYVMQQFVEQVLPRREIFEPIDPLAINKDLALLHPVCRSVIRVLVQHLQAAGSPMGVFEAYRSPERQLQLYAQGRTTSGNIVTKSEPWRSYHQYGLAVDFVLFENGKPSWKTDGGRQVWWNQLHSLGQACGLERLDFELPHLQLKGLTPAGLKAGHWPLGGDDDWRLNFESAVKRWHGTPAAPVLVGH